tara:strand:+ start:443 stop:1333 length:891 start_codon:yes stop_codon:yes gene_type:complete
MHPKNPYNNRYNIKRLVECYPLLQNYIVVNPSNEKTIDFNSSKAVYALNKAILLADFRLKDYFLPKGYLIPPVPGRLDYLLYLRDFISKKFNIKQDLQLNGLDIGCGANGIYCILGAQYFNWKMEGIDCNEKAIEIVNNNISITKELQKKVKIRYQENKSFLFKNIIQSSEKFDFLVCNPPFHSSKEDAIKGSFRKLNNIVGQTIKKSELYLNFEGQANELWCNGGEILFIKRLIKESVVCRNQVKTFSTLVAKSESLPKIEKQLNKVKADYHVINTTIGNKKSRYLVWWFESSKS